MFSKFNYFISDITALFHFRYADQVLIDDEILVEKYNKFVPTKVTNVSDSVMEGNSFYWIPAVSHNSSI